MNKAETAADDLRAVNQRFYDRLWSRARLIAPDRFNTWPLVESLLDLHPRRLEIAPGMRPRLPIPGTTFVDISQHALKALSDQGGSTELAELNQLPFGEASFDFVALLDVVEHVEDDAGALNEVARVLRPNGRFLLSVPLHPANWTAFDAIVGHYRRYSPSDIRALLLKANLRIDQSAVYGMKPKTTWLVRIGMWFLENQPKRAMRWYNRVMPFVLRRQQPLRFVDGLIDDPEVDEIIILGTRTAGSAD